MPALQSREVDDVILAWFNDTKILDEPVIQRIGDELEELVKQASVSKKLVLDFRNVSFMSSAMIGKLVKFRGSCKDSNVELRLCAISDNLMDIFKITGLNKAFKFFETEEEALQSFKKKGWFS